MISVIIPTYNRVSLLLNTVSSLLYGCENSELSDVEIIVSDDGSSDQTFESLSNKFADCKNFKYVYMPDDGYRVARARNLGAKIASGDILVFCDAGVVACSGFLSAHAKCHQTSDNRFAIGYVAGIYPEQTEKLQNNRYLYNNADPNRSHLDPRERIYSLHADDLSTVPAPWALAWTANVSLHRSVWEEVGGFDENFVGWGCEDIEFAFRAYKTGAQFCLRRDARVYHEEHSRNEDRRGGHRLNLDYFHKKHNVWETEYLKRMSTIDLNLLGSP